jgi:Ca2+-binding EF-hand superfamily protein
MSEQVESSKAFFERKWMKFFNVLDTDKDGVVTKKDHELMGERFAAASPHVDAARKEEMKQQFLTIWEKVIEADGKTQAITPKYFISLLGKQGLRGLGHLYQGICDAMFRVIDTDGDGFIQVAELQSFFKLFCNDEQEATRAFAIIDTNNDGKISNEEFSTAFMDFLTGEDQQSPYRYFFGSLQ